MSSNLSTLSFGFGSNIYKQTNFENDEENIIIKRPVKVTNANKIIWANMYSTLGYYCTNNNGNDNNNTLKIFGFDVLFNKEKEEEKIIKPTTLENLNKPKKFFGNDLYGLIGYIDINGNLYKLEDYKKYIFDVDDNNSYNINIIDIDQFWNGDEVIFVTEDGKLWKWNIKNDNLQEISLPFSHSSLSSLNIIFKKVSCGENHCLALTNQGEVYSWGDGRYGQLGHGDFRTLNKPKVIEFFQGLKVTQIACGGSYSAVITDSGDLYTFGWNNLGRLGVKANTTNTSIPCLIEFNSGDADYGEVEEDISVLKVACGSAHTVVITDDNKLWACGWGKYGQQGLDNLNDNFTFTRIDCDSWDQENKKIVDCYCGRWNTFIMISDDNNK